MAIADSAVFVATGTDTVLNPDFVGRLSYDHDGFETTLTISLSKTIPSSDRYHPHLVSSITLNASTYLSLEYEEININQVKALKPGKFYPPDEVVRAFKAQLCFVEDFADSNLTIGCHEHAQNFAESIKTHNSLTIYIIGHSSTKNNVDETIASFMREKELPVWQLWHKSDGITWQKRNMVSKQDRPRISEYKRPNSYSDVDSYATQIGCAVIFAQEEKDVARYQYEKVQTHIRTMFTTFE